MNGGLFITAQQVCEAVFRPLVPYTQFPKRSINGGITLPSTGNMRFNATKVVAVDENTVNIYVDADIAPYVVYTNEPWISERWRGNKNPNEGWFEKATFAVAQRLAAMLGGTLTVGDDFDKTKEAQTLDYRVNRAARDDTYNNYYGGRYRERSYVNAIRQSNT